MSITNSCWARAVRLSDLLLMAVLHRTGLGKFENLKGSRISSAGRPRLSPTVGRSLD